MYSVVGKTAQQSSGEDPEDLTSLVVQYRSSADDRAVTLGNWNSARVLWRYLRLHETTAPADAIVILGSNDIRVADRGADLARRDVAPLVVLSGSLGNFTRGSWSRTEAAVFADVVIGSGVSRSRVLLEEASTNTGDNLRLSLKLLQQRGIDVRRLQLVHKPFMERRTRATADVVCPGVLTRVTSPRLTFDQYPNRVLSRSHIVTAMVGDLDRIVGYPLVGYQSAQFVPTAVTAASDRLKEAGFTGHAQGGMEP